MKFLIENSKFEIKTKWITIHSLIFCIAVMVFWGCRHETKKENSNEVLAEAPDATREREQGYLLPGLDHGLMQSPINIKSFEAKETTEHSVVLNYEKSHEKVVNLGHTIQVNYDEGNTISFDNKIYDFKQFHFHTPSEHLIDGVTYPMELHMVHTLQGQKPEDTPVYCVVGILFKEGRENEFINEFMDAIPDNAGEEHDVEGGIVNINDLLDQETDLAYYHYQGSLTTPPYTETVTWLVFKQILEASPEQLEKLNRLEGNNARHVQAIYARKVDAD